MDYSDYYEFRFDYERIVRNEAKQTYFSLIYERHHTVDAR